MRPFLIIVGIQKSGTTLLNRLVQEHGIARSVFHTEGNDLWGNEPPFCPRGVPLGEVYQLDAGAHGHEVGVEHATDDMRDLLHARLARIDAGADAIVNKNPYLTVSLRWLRLLFPRAAIVAMARDPVANAYSLAKKYVPHEDRGLAPDEGFWGVKPRAWRDLVRDDKRMQCALHWDAVNRRLLRDMAWVDRLILYHDLCRDPEEVLSYLHLRLHGSTPPPFERAALTCLDDEYARGSALRSKNRHYRERGTLEVPSADTVEFRAWNDAEVAEVRTTCAPTWDALRAVTTAKPW